MTAPETFHVVPVPVHDRIVESAYRHRGYDADEARAAARIATAATTHGIRTHNAIKALHLDALFGSKAGGCVPGARARRLPSRFDAAEVWDGNRKLGQAVAIDAMERCMALADRHGVGIVSVDNAFHYLWGGGYVMEAARRGYVAYTNCTASLAEVVPFRGTFPTLGTNPHSWGFPTTEAVGFPVVIDWATSVIAMGRVQQLEREGRPLPPNAAVDAAGKPTTDPGAAVALVPFGEHKGYGLSLVNEIVAALVGGSLPTIRNRAAVPGEKQGCVFFFQAIHPDAVSGGAFAAGRSQAANVKAVLADILDHGNGSCLLPGQVEALAAERTCRAGGLLFSTAEIAALNELARESGVAEIDVASLPVA